jgi:hypothetical protein
MLQSEIRERARKGIKHNKDLWLANDRESRWDLDLEIDLLRQVCHSDFWSFFLYAFGAGSNPKGQRWIDPDVHLPLAEWLQKHVDEWLAARDSGVGVQKHLAILIPREVGKSTLITQALQLWLHLRDPEMSTYTGCENSTLAAKNMESVKAILDGSDPYSLFSKLYGNWSGQARKWTGKEIVHAARKNTARRDPSFGTFAVETSITGTHPDAIFYDDPISYERISTDSNWLETVNQQVISLIPVLQSDGLRVFVGTRYDQNDHFGSVFATDGVKSLTGMPTDSISEDPGGIWHVYFMAGRDRENKPAVAKVWPEWRLREYHKAHPLKYAAQIMNDPDVSEHNPITREQLATCVMPKEQIPWSSLRYAILCDTAFWDAKSHIRKDETVMEVWGYPRNGSGDVYFVEGFGSNTWRAEDFGNLLVTTVQRYRRQGKRIFAITDEVTMAGKKDAWRLALQNFFSDVGEPMPRFYQFDRGSAKKIQRMVAAAAYWVDGHVRVCEGAPGATRLLDQMARIGQFMVNPKLKDDWADAGADAFHPELYQPMRRKDLQKAPWEANSKLFDVEGLDHDIFESDTVRTWRSEHPREPI